MDHVHRHHVYAHSAHTHLKHAHSLAIRRMVAVARVAHVLPCIELEHKAGVGLHRGAFALHHAQHVIGTGTAKPHEVRNHHLQTCVV